jgi:predicted PurR-regulated permease PerM
MNPLPPPTPAQARLIWLAVTGVAIATLVGLIAALVWGLGRVLDILSPVLWPLAVAGVLAYLLDPLVDLIEHRGTPRTRAIVYVFSMALVIVVGVFSLVLPQVVRQGRDLAQRIPAYASELQDRVERWIDNPPAVLKHILDFETAPRPAPGQPVSVDTNTTAVRTNGVPAAPSPAAGDTARTGPTIDKESFQTATGLAAKFLPKVGSWLFGQVGRVASWFGVVAGLALIPVYAFYFLLEKRRISTHWTNYLPVRDSAFKEELVFVLNSINNYLIAFFRGQVLVAICDGILYAIGFLLIGLPYALLIGFAAIFLTIIPFIGAIVVCTTALIIAVVQFGDWTHPLMVAGVFAVVQMLEGFVIQPRIMGDRVGLHPVTIIIAVMAGTTLLGGLLGGILALPLTAALRVVMFRYVWKKRQDPTASSGAAPVSSG